MNTSNANMNERIMQRPAADYAAGDLDASEADLFAKALATDEDLQQEVAFWERMQRELPQAGRPTDARIPGPGLAAAVRRRAHALESDRTPAAANAAPIKLWTALAISGWAVAAVGLFAVFLGNSNFTSASSAADNGLAFVGYDEHGHSVLISEQDAGDSQLILNRTSILDSVASANHTPWLGLWTQPIELRGFDHDRGLQIRHVEAGSPASTSGLKQGDILIEFGDCPMHSRHCISHTIDSGRLTAGDSAKIVYIDGQTGKTVESQIVIGYQH